MSGVGCNRLITVDGFRAEFDGGWYLLRLSGTEPKLRVSAEARSKDELDRMMGQARNIVKRCMR
jgi:phosphoglucosamine mutase